MAVSVSVGMAVTISVEMAETVSVGNNNALPKSGVRVATPLPRAALVAAMSATDPASAWERKKFVAMTRKKMEVIIKSTNRPMIRPVRSWDSPSASLCLLSIMHVFGK
jgi:hypothetical protein